MGSERIKIKTVCDVFDGPHATPKKIETGPVYLGIDAITEDGRLNEAEFNYLSERDYLIWTKRVTPQEGDIVFSYEATLGRYAMIPKGFYGCLGRRLALIRNKSDQINTKWLFYYFQSPEWKAFINSHIIKGSTVDRISVEDFPDYTIPKIDLQTQERIVDILGHMDNRIQNNLKIVECLKQQIKLLYNYWFTQFDFPDDSGRPYKATGGSMVYSDELKQDIPYGWKVESVFKNSLTTVIKPGVQPFVEKTYLATADVNGMSISSGNIIDYENRENRANMQPTEYSVWFAKMKNSIKHLYLNPEMSTLIENAILSTGFCGLQCNELSFEYMSSFIMHSYFESLKDTFAHGATQQAVNNDDLAGIILITPSDAIICKYHEKTKAIFAKMSKCVCENQELISVRNWLLPMLMNQQATIIND